MAMPYGRTAHPKREGNSPSPNRTPGSWPRRPGEGANPAPAVAWRHRTSPHPSQRPTLPCERGRVAARKRGRDKQKEKKHLMATLKDLSNDIAALVETASKSIVQVDARRGRAGTGIIWDNGLVLTANHVVEQEQDIEVVLGDTRSKATLVGRDPATDIALLKVDGLSAPALPRAKVEDLKPGQIVLAIGRPGSLKATFGTISSVSSSWRGWRGSEIEHLIQTNAPLYPGFSGGPLVDVDGRVVGMNSWVFGRGDGRAIAMDVADRVAASLRSEGGIKRPYLEDGTQ